MKKFTVWFRLILSLWLVIGGMEGAVLCFESDGHLRLEFLQGSSCHRVPDRIASSFSETSLGTSSPLPVAVDNCGPCTDIALSTADTVHRSAHHATTLVLQHQLLPADLVPTTAVGCCEIPDDSRLSELRFTAFSQTLAYLSSIVLLI